jgi:hypothetical protein
MDGESETPNRRSGKDGWLLTSRSAGILGASFLLAVVAAALAYLAVGKPSAGLAGAVLAGGAAFAGAVRLLNSIIALATRR